MNNLQLKTTADGSSTIYHRELDEHYHSIHGALQESVHVFIKSGLNYFQNKYPFNKTVNILEIGWGTGLNCILSLISKNSLNQIIKYSGIEPFPVNLDIIENLNFNFNKEEIKLFHIIHQLKCDEKHIINSYFQLTKHSIGFNNFKSSKTYDIVYFDAFAPRKQPSIWTSDVFTKLYEHLNSNGILVTYCAKGQVRRDLESVGFYVERLKGPPGKREMLRGIKIIKK